ncbi:hypothetical protein [Sodalis sp. C49]|uniref:hypothetical protein n=1 Tax=unclassified Sodalis (in: enterobacteria) TaxID=2636512 RepID=UPI003965A0EE
MKKILLPVYIALAFLLNGCLMVGGHDRHPDRRYDDRYNHHQGRLSDRDREHIQGRDRDRDNSPRYR